MRSAPRLVCRYLIPWLGIGLCGCTSFPSIWPRSTAGARSAPATSGAPGDLASPTAPTPTTAATPSSQPTVPAVASTVGNNPPAAPRGGWSAAPTVPPDAPPRTAATAVPVAWQNGARRPESASDNRPTDLIEPARIVGMVGDQPILAGDIQGMVNVLLAVQLKDMPEAEKEKAGEQIEGLRRQLFKQVLKSEVNTKLGYIDFMRGVPPEKKGELQKRVKSSFEKEFEEVRNKWSAATTDEQKQELVQRHRSLAHLAILMQHHKLDNVGQLDAFLRSQGSSLDKQIRAYGEQKLQQMSVMKNVRTNVEVTHEQMLAYYREHAADYDIPAKARWEQLTVRFDRFSNEEAAQAALAEMGNEVYLGGAPLAAVAKRASQESHAEQGGMHDWTQQDSLASKPLDDAIFSLPLGRLSEIIRDDRGLHIVRVIERTDATRTPFLEAQTDIKEKIRLERRNQDIQAYFEKVRKNIPVWTIDDAPADQPAEPVKNASTPAGRSGS